MIGVTICVYEAVAGFFNLSVGVNISNKCDNNGVRVVQFINLVNQQQLTTSHRSGGGHWWIWYIPLDFFVYVILGGYLSIYLFFFHLFIHGKKFISYNKF